MIADRRHAPRAGLYVVVLAAGASARLGRPKALVRLAGTPLVRRQCLKAEALAPGRVVLVTGRGAGAVGAALRGLPVRRVHNRHWRRGQGGSVATGIRALPRAARHALVLTVDQWALGVAALRRLAAAAGRHPLGADLDGRPGVPMLIPRAWFARLAALTGERGAQAALAGAVQRRLSLDGALEDLDTRADLDGAQRRMLAGRPRARR